MQGRFVSRTTSGYKDVIQQWAKDIQKDEEQKEADSNEKWPFGMTLPCRGCSESKGPLPLTAFTTARHYKEIWRTCISKGQLLTCFTCVRSMGFTVGASDAVIYCDGCCCMKPKREFNKDMYQKWQVACADEDILCKACCQSGDTEQDNEVL